MRKYKTKEFCFSEKERSIIDGLLLGDGFINKHGYTLGLNTASKEFATYVFSLLDRSVWTNAGIMKCSIYDKRIGKTLTMYRIVSHPNAFFEKERKRWYDECGNKVIPNDVRLNSSSVLLWYLGDGTLSQRISKKSTSEIKICTNSFLKENIENDLLPAMSCFGAKIRVINKKEPVIIIPRRSIDSFLDFIGKPPFSEYSHKWNVFPYKNKNIEKNGISRLSLEKQKEIVNRYVNGEKVKNIAKDIGIDISHAIYFCKKAGVYSKGRDKTEYEILKNGELFGKTKNLKQFCKNNGLCYANMISVCSGKQKKYKDFTIKKI